MPAVRATICTENEYVNKFDQRLSMPHIVIDELYNLMSLTRGFGSLALSIPVVIEAVNNSRLSVSLNNLALQPSQQVVGWVMNDHTWIPQAPNNMEGLFFSKPGTDMVVEVIRGYFIKYSHITAQHEVYNQTKYNLEPGQQLDLLA